MDDGIPFRLLLLLSGDVEVHPGPSASFNFLVAFVTLRLLTAIRHCVVIFVINGFTLLVTLILKNTLTMIWLLTPLQLCCANCSHFEPEVNTRANVINSPTQKCICINVRGICAKKLDLFAHLAAYPCNIIAITETFFDSSIDDVEFAPHSYLDFRRDRSRHSGGVMIIVCDHIPVIR